MSDPERAELRRLCQELNRRRFAALDSWRAGEAAAYQDAARMLAQVLNAGTFDAAADEDGIAAFIAQARLGLTPRDPDRRGVGG